MEFGMVAAVVVLTLDDGRTEEVALEQSDTVGRVLFTDRNDIVAATIPEGVTTIEEYAFTGCSSLVSVVIPEGVTSIGTYAFSDCSSLASVTIPEGVTRIEENAFHECTSLTSVTIPNSVMTIGRYAFYDCSSLVSVVIPDGVTTIEAWAFRGCSSLASVTIPEGVTRIGKCAFGGCLRLASVTIPEGVRTIEAWAFSMCGLLQASIMNPLAQIYSTSFSNCNLIDRVNIHNSATIIFLGGEEKKLREPYQGRPAWQHVFPSCPAANIKWRTSVREKYEAGFVDRTTAMAMLLSMRRTREDPRFPDRFPAEMMKNVLEYAV